MRAGTPGRSCVPAPDGSTTLLLPDEAGQRAVMELIYQGVKGGRADFPTGEIRHVLAGLRERGAQAFILGCTELPVAFRQYRLEGAAIDPTLVLAWAAIRACQAPLIA